MRVVYSLILLSLLAWQRAGAQLAPAEQFFNSGAQFYISNDIPAALDRVEMGLKAYPNDEKLKKLEQLLKQQQQQNQQQNQQDQKQQDQKNQQPEKNQGQQQKDQEKNPDQQKQEEEQKKQSDPKKSEDQKPQNQKQDSGDKPNDENQEQPAQPVKTGEMTPEGARGLLDAQKGNEQLLQFKPDGKPRNSNRPVKDW